MRIDTCSVTPTLSEVVNLFSGFYPGLSARIVLRACQNRGVEIRNGRIMRQDLRSIYFGIMELSTLTPSQIDARNRERGTPL